MVIKRINDKYIAKFTNEDLDSLMFAVDFAQDVANNNLGLLAIEENSYTELQRAAIIENLLKNRTFCKDFMTAMLAVYKE